MQALENNTTETIKRYRFGTPVETGAVVEKGREWEKEDLFLTQTERGLSYLMSDTMAVYGLGENTRGMNKRGWIYRSCCTDNPCHTEGVSSLYGAHNFLLLNDGNLHIGLFVDTPGIVTFDIGYERYDALLIMAEDDFDLYVIEGSLASSVIWQFRRLIGRSYIPPKWAFGYGQSRWGYKTSEEIREVVRRHREQHIPLDSVYLDIDYMERYKDFTVNRETFPDFEELAAEMKKEHIHLVPIIDGGIKVEEGYDVYEEGAAQNYFCKDEEGEDFIVGVWPGRCCFPDLLNEEARRWFGRKYQRLLEKGIDGFWNDMNEPAIFYSEKRLKEVFEKLDEYKQKNLSIDTFFKFRDLAPSLCNNEEDYRSFYHDYNGQKIRHDKVHNLFGFYMTRSAAEAFGELEPNRRILLFSRASYIGMHRYGGIWQGDNRSWWAHLLMNIQMMPSLNMCGFLYTGADLGGFGDHVTEDLMIRWLSFGIFTPLMRNHSAIGTRMQEVYRFAQAGLMRNIIKIRYRLLPYLYSEFMKAALNDTMMFWPLAFIYPEDPAAAEIEDQLLIGENLMIAPVYVQNAKGRMVYLPERMKMLRFQKDGGIKEDLLEKGWSYVDMPLGEVCVFIRDHYLLPLAEGGEHVEDVDFENLTQYSCGDDVKPYEYYMDDGETKEYSLEKQIRLLLALPQMPNAINAEKTNMA